MYQLMLISVNSCFILINVGRSYELYFETDHPLGAVYDYNDAGLNRSLDGWSQCLAVPVLELEDMHEKAMWDIRVAEVCTYSEWVPNK